MKKYVITIEEIISQEFELELPEDADPVEVATDKYKKGELVLENAEVHQKSIAAMEKDKPDTITNWTEF